MSTKVASLFADLGVDSSKLTAGLAQAKTGLREADGSVKQLTGSTRSLTGMFTQLAAGLGLAQAGRMMIQFGRDSLQAAGDVAETMSKFRIVFGESARLVEQALNDFAAATGRSQYEMYGFAATLQDTFVPLGFARDEAAKLSVQVVKLATDLASFNNLNTADVVRDLQSALVGNTETLRKYGVVAQETQIKQYLVNQGLWQGTEAVDGYTKAQAILALVQAGTTDAQGDAIRTSDSYVNTLRSLESQVLDLKVALGEEMLPAMQAVNLKGIELVGNLVTLVRQYGALRDTVLGVNETALNANTYDDYLAALGDLGQAYDRSRSGLLNLFGPTAMYKAAVEGLFRATGGLTEAQWQLQKAQKVTGSTYEEYTHNLIDNLEASGRITSYIADMARKYFDLNGSVDTLNWTLGSQAVALGVVDEATWNMNTSLAVAAERQAELAINSELADKQMQLQARGSELLTSALDHTAGQVPILATAMRDMAGSYDAASTAARLLEDGISAVTDSMVEQARLKLVLKLATEDLTADQMEELLNQQETLENMAALNQAYEDGKISKYEWIGAISDGLVTQEELNRLLGVENDELLELNRQLRSIPANIKTTYTFDVNVTGDPLPTGSPATPGGGGPGNYNPNQRAAGMIYAPVVNIGAGADLSVVTALRAELARSARALIAAGGAYAGRS